MAQTNPMPGSPIDADVEILSLELDDFRYALPLASVEQVIRSVAITPLPGAPAVIAGVIDLRGRIIPVIDLRRRFGLAERPVGLDEQFLVVAIHDRVMALRAGRALGVHRVAPADVASGDLAQVAAHLAGAVRLPDGLLFLADVPRFLSPAESATTGAALHAGTAPARLLA